MGAIFDLSQIIRRGSYNTGHDLDLASVWALIVLRELSYSFSIGMRLFFFWSFVAEPPRGELPPIPLPDDRRPNFLTIESETNIHSGSWQRFSYLGFVLKWGLLLLTVGDPVLQAFWRIDDTFSRFGPLYYTEGTLQIVLSSLFILKVLANTYLSSMTPRWKTLRDYSPMVLAMLISVGLGVGNILCCKRLPSRTCYEVQLTVSSFA